MLKRKMRTVLRSLALLALLPVTALARSSAPEPKRAVDPAFFTGQWYEIARTDNWRQKDCEAPTYRFDPLKSATATFTLTCRHGSPTGPSESVKVTIKVPQDEQRNKFRVATLGGLLAADYWVLDIADDNSWSILSTAGGNYVWILSRRPTLDSSLKTRLLGDIRAMGYDMSKIIQPKQA